MKRPLVLALILAACSASRPEDPRGLGEPVGTVSGQLRVFQGTRQGLDAPVSTPVPVPVPVRSAPVAGAWTLPPGVHVGPLQHLAAGEHVIPGEVLVRFEAAGVAPAAALRALALDGLRAQHGGYGSRYLHVVRYRHPDGRTPTVEETRRLVAALAARPGVRFTTVNRWAFPTAVPDDPLYTAQWHYRILNLPAAWDVAPRSPGVVVAVVDTGVRPHPELTPRLLPGADLVSDPENAGDGDGRDLDPIDPGRDMPQESSSWHGSHVAGTVGAASNNGQGVAGVSWEVQLLPVRVVGRMGGSTADVIAGIEWAMGEEVPGLPGRNPTPAQVINLSLGTTGEPDPAYQEAVDRATARGAVLVVAAGNENELTAEKVPCNQRDVVCVGATRLDGRRASYSNFGPHVDLMAPGGEGAEDLDADELPDAILSTYFDQQGQPGYGFLQGTSMAAPHVAGVVALMKAVNPALTPAQVEEVLRETAAASFRCPEGCGAGLVNAQAAVLRAQGREEPPGPGQLALSVEALLLAGEAPVGLTLLNTGGSPLQVTARFTAATPGVSVRFPTGATVDIPPGGERVLQVAQVGAGVAPGLYEGMLQLVPSEGEPQALPVRIRVGRPPDARPARVVVVRREGEHWQVVGAAEARPEGQYTYEVAVPPGVYFVVAGIDEDEDGDHFEPGERSGMYPTLDRPLPIVVQSGAVTAGVNFDLLPYAPEDASTASSLGAACDEAADCPGGVCDLSVPGGYCTLDCSAASCPAGSACYPRGTARMCLASCSAPGAGQSTCREGQVCVEDGAGSGYCQPRCAGGSCGLGARCNVGTGYCG